MASPTLETIQLVFAEVPVEAFMFVLAFVIHFLLNNCFRFVPSKGKIIEEKKRKFITTAFEVDGGSKMESCLTRKETRPQEKMDVAYQKGHWAAALRHWYAQRDNEATTPGQLLQVVEAMQRLNLATAPKIHEVGHFLSRHPGSCHIYFINRLFTMLVKSMDMEVIAALLECLPKFKIRPDSRTYEMLIQLHFTMQSTDEMLMLARDMEANGVAPSVATQVTLLKGALKKGDLDMAIPLYCQVYESCPSYVESTLASLACQQRQGTRVIGCFESKKLPLRLEMLDVMVRANLHMRDRKLAARISKLCKTFGIEIDSHNKHVFGIGPMQGESPGEVGSVGDGGHCAAQEQPALAENASFEAADKAGSEQCSSPQHQQETSRVQEKNQPQASGSWTPYNTKNYWAQDDDKCHWESGGAQGNRSSKWVEASGDSSWEWSNWSWDATKKPWAKEQNKHHIKQYKEGAYKQLC